MLVAARHLYHLQQDLSSEAYNAARVGLKHAEPLFTSYVNSGNPLSTTTEAALDILDIVPFAPALQDSEEDEPSDHVASPPPKKKAASPIAAVVSPKGMEMLRASDDEGGEVNEEVERPVARRATRPRESTEIAQEPKRRKTSAKPSTDIDIESCSWTLTGKERVGIQHGHVLQCIAHLVGFY